ncbi:MAG TPA: 16S rRNA (cytidine(1402)-2'-O)-methyltransferase [Candidatus Dormibacteraeota bacterium]|nr:16S rRNA (cytidine(1402)-2'-O)-methyltransferase [Candidatus Dormibacteraeota bacterium]
MPRLFERDQVEASAPSHGRIVLVPTPLGNLGDLTLRALETLRAADVIACEDTRVTRKLLSHFGIAGKPLHAYHEHNARVAGPKLVAMAAAGRMVAVVTDAGMPGVSDPGSALVNLAREAGVALDLLPGPCAFVSGAVLSGFPVAGLRFGGFLPRAAGERLAALRAAADAEGASAWYESPQRIGQSLRDAERAGVTRCFLLREYTKLHEQRIVGTPGEVLAALPDPVRGEVVLVVEGHGAEPKAAPEGAEIDARIDALISTGAGVSAIARTLAAEGLGDRRELYARAVRRKGEGGAAPPRD